MSVVRDQGARYREHPICDPRPERFGRRCDPKLGCGRPLRPGDAWTCDHIQAVINGGPNRESNLHPLCEWCEPPKTEADVHEKSRSYRRRLRHAGPAGGNIGWMAGGSGGARPREQMAA